MKAQEFEHSVTALKSHVIMAIEGFFGNRKIAFDLGAYIQDNSVDWDALAREAFFIGTSITPKDIPEGSDPQKIAA